MLLAAETTHKSNKRKREVLHPELESALLAWFLQHEREGPISGEPLREQARKLYALMYPNHMVPQLRYHIWSVCHVFGQCVMYLVSVSCIWSGCHVFGRGVMYQVSYI